jgi:hypothetical protein
MSIRNWISYWLLRDTVENNEEVKDSLKALHKAAFNMDERIENAKKINAKYWKDEGDDK